MTSNGYFFIDSFNISKFLNRLLGLQVALQNALFQYFTNTLEAVIQRAKRNGRYDEGILGNFVSATNEHLDFSTLNFFLFIRFGLKW